MDRRSFLAGGLGALLAACGQARDPAALGTLTPSPSPVAPGATPAEADPPDRGSGPGGTADSPPASASVALPVLCRDAWGARPADAGLVGHTIDRMMVHHTAAVLADNADAPGRLRQHQRFHQAQGWPDIAYHVGVDRHGHVYALRTPEARGDTFTDYDPTGWLLVTAEGHFDEQTPTDAQVEGLARVLAWGAIAFGAPMDSVAAHRDYAATTCPGDALYRLLPDVRARASELAGAVTRSQVCGSPGRELVAAIEAGRA